MVYNQIMISTQAFAELCDSTKRTIIHYDRIGLLKPASRRGRNRLYRPKQVLTFQKIMLLKLFGLRLTEIKRYLYRNNELKRLFLRQRSQLKSQKLTLEKRIAKIEEYLGNLKKNQPMVVPKIKKVKPYSFYGLQKVGRYVDIDKHQRELFSLIGDKKGKHVGLTIFFESYYSPHHANMITGAVVGEKEPKKLEGVEIFETLSHKAVSYLHVGPYAYMSYVWQFLDRYVKDHHLKRHPKLLCREFYLIGPLSGADEDNFVTELQVPIK
jgi:DNA-binding transcriptional MerR regulator